MVRAAVLAASLVVACGGNANDKKDAGVTDAKRDAKPADAKVFMDAPPPQFVHMVTCPATPDATITTMSFAFVPNAATITVNGIVKFTPEAIHDVVPGHVPADATIADPGLTVGFGATTCLQFTMAGTYGFHCGPHLFDGTITVN